MLISESVHPEYQFNKYIKETEYQLIIQALGDKQVKYAVTLPGLSNYAFERKLIAKYPGIVIHCFENNKNKNKGDIYNTIVKDFDIPEGVILQRCSVEDWLKKTSQVYDMIFLDYCSGPAEDIDTLIKKKLSQDGILAVTLNHSRGHSHTICPKGLSLAIDPLHYSQMYFLGFRNSTQKKDVLSVSYLGGACTKKTGSVKTSIWESFMKKFTQKPSEIFAEKVRGAIQELSDKQKEVLTMRLDNGYTYKAIGEKLGLSELGVYFRVKSSIKSIKNLLASSARKESPRRISLMQAVCNDKQPPKDLANKLNAEVQKLPAKFKEPLVMRFESQYTYENIGEKLGISTQVAYLRVKSATKNLKSALNSTSVS